MQSQREYVLRTVEERSVQFIQLWFTDVLGIPKTFSITPAELQSALEEGMTFDGSAIDGFSRVQESDVLATPDPKTFQILPFSSAPEAAVARVVCDISNLDGTPFEGDPRRVLRRQLEKAHEAGFSFFVAPELEYFYFANADGSKPPQPLDHGSYFELTVNDLATELRKRTVLTLEDMGIPVEYAQHEDAPSQHEIDLRYTDALTMADTIMTVRLVVKEIAQERGVHATFMPKPLPDVQGSGMHTHFSLFTSDGLNAFYDENAERGLSVVARQFIAGLLEHAREITVVTNQWVNSYKRLVAGTEAPFAVSWAANNRSALVRLPVVKRGKSESTRAEYRALDPACNPYLAFAVILAAGLNGIKNGYELPPEAAQNLFTLSPEELSKAGIKPLPRTLDEAVDAMERSELVAEALGEHVFEWFIRNKRSEWTQYCREVTPYELNRYLPALLRRTALDPLVCYPDPLPIELTKTLEQASYPFVGVNSAEAAQRLEPDDGWAGAIIVGLDDRDAAFNLCRVLRKRENPLAPLLLVIEPAHLGELELREDLFDDFCLAPIVGEEVEARLAHLLWRTGRGKQHDVIVYGPLALNLETYQAVIVGRPLDLTFMEYELLRFLAAHPGKVFTREVLLSRVGYEYFGGARTVDVHIRRLRAKLGEEHANLIDTVRSVGYRFGRARWAS